MLHKVNKSASYIYRISNRTSVVTQQEGLEIKLWFATSAKENIVAKKQSMSIYNKELQWERARDRDTHQLKSSS